MTVSTIAQKLADAVSPTLQSAARYGKDKVIASLPSRLFRFAARQFYEDGVEVIPRATGFVCNESLTYLCGRPFAELIEGLESHAKERGLALHPTTVAAIAGLRRATYLK